MIVTQVENYPVKGVPDYYKIYLRLLQRYEANGDNDCLVLAFHYARVAEELGQVVIDDDPTLEENITEITNVN